MDRFIDMITLVIFGYLTFCGISNKGKIFENENVHPSKAEEYAQNARKFSLIMGPIGILSVALMWIPNGGQIWKTLGFVCYGLALIGVILFVVYTYRVGKEYVKKHADKKK